MGLGRQRAIELFHQERLPFGQCHAGIRQPEGIPVEASSDGARQCAGHRQSGHLFQCQPHSGASAWFREQLGHHDFHAPGLRALQKIRWHPSEEVQDISGLARIHPAQIFDFDSQLFERAERLNDLNLQPAVGKGKRLQVVEQHLHAALASREEEAA